MQAEGEGEGTNSCIKWIPNRQRHTCAALVSASLRAAYKTTLVKRKGKQKNLQRSAHAWLSVLLKSVSLNV